MTPAPHESPGQTTSTQTHDAHPSHERPVPSTGAFGLHNGELWTHRSIDVNAHHTLAGCCARSRTHQHASIIESARHAYVHCIRQADPYTVTVPGPRGDTAAKAPNIQAAHLQADRIRKQLVQRYGDLVSKTEFDELAKLRKMEVFEEVDRSLLRKGQMIIG